MRLLPQDALVALRIALHPAESTNAQLAADLGLSGSQVHYALERCRASGLILKGSSRASVPHLLEFLVHGLRYVFPPQLGPVVRGVPTAHSAPPLNRQLLAEDAVVWPHPKGEARGVGLVPLHKSVPMAAMRDEKMYQALALIDALRVGRVRDRALAERHLKKLLLDAAESEEP